MAGRAGRDVLPRAVATRTLDVELHPSAGLLNRPLALALRACSRRLDKPRTRARRACVPPSDIQAHHPAPDRRPTRHIDLVFEIRPRFWPLFGPCPAPVKHTGEDVAEPAASGGSLLPAPTAALE